jgi:hypothetical protein
MARPPKITGSAPRCSTRTSRMTRGPACTRASELSGTKWPRVSSSPRTTRPNCRPPYGRLPTRHVSPWTGLTHRPSWCHHGQGRAAVVLTRPCVSVPFRERRRRFVTVNHGHPRPLDLGVPYYRCPAARMVRMESRTGGEALPELAGGPRPCGRPPVAAVLGPAPPATPPSPVASPARRATVPRHQVRRPPARPSRIATRPALAGC